MEVLGFVLAARCTGVQSCVTGQVRDEDEGLGLCAVILNACLFGRIGHQSGRRDSEAVCREDEELCQMHKCGL